MMLSLAIMAHPSRAAQVAELEAQLPAAQVVWDEIGSRWDTGRRSMLAYDAAADFHCVVQDDAVLCDNFIEQVQAALATVGAGPVAFYLGRSYLAGWPTALLLRRARAKGASWIQGPGPHWGVAVAVRTSEIAAMVAWCDGSTIQNYDLRMAAYWKARGRLCSYSVPCLVDHHAGPSLVTGRGSNGRRAACFAVSGAESWSARALVVGQRRRGVRHSRVISSRDRLPV